ncbi:MAG: hypothetical protein GXP62_15575 [Oligoflexia bacterium]|nr:hypothetical protein [Oligoflexia bacterium]
MVRPPARSRLVVLALPLTVGLALLLRVLRVPPRWCANAWLYAAYPWQTVQALAHGQPPPFTGLHPPLWPVLHALSELFAPVPLVWLLGSALASTLAAAFVARRSVLAGLLVATSPVQLAYAAEVNNYPLAACLVAALLVLRDRAVAGRWLALALVGILAAWTHALAGLAALLIALTLPPRLSWRVLLVLALGALPLVAPALHLATATGNQPPFKTALVVHSFVDRFGLVWLLAAPAALLGARRQPWLLVPALGLGAALAVLTGLRVAAPHQFPYWVMLGLPLALMVGAARGRAVRGLAVVAVVVHGGLALSHGISRLLALRQDLDRERAVDLALSSLDQPWTCGATPSPSCTGDALYLLLPHRVDDDDKRPLTPSLWRLAPWSSMPAVQPYAMDWGDFHNGQPRLVEVAGKPHAVYVEDHVRDDMLKARAAHSRLVVVLAAGTDSAEGRALNTLLGQPGQAVGGDALWW